MKIVVVGGGPAGFFAAIAAKKGAPEACVVLHERSAKVLSKVRVSGGGRCNVTHACFDPKKLIENYPRGSKELLGPFHHFQPADTIQWFAEHGVELKTEKDGRMFPTTDSSQTIIDCLLATASDLGVEIQLRSKVTLKEYDGDRLILATGSAEEGWEMAKELGHTIQPPVPSLFTLNIADFALESLSGISLEHARLKLEHTQFVQEGPLLITQWGFSGPAALKLSAFAARELADNHYEMGVVIDWIPLLSLQDFASLFASETPQRRVKNMRQLPLPRRLWQFFLGEKNQQLSRWSQQAIGKLYEKLKADRYQVKGKTTNKEEFVTCGGVTLSEINFKTMESKLRPGVYFCGEMLDIDGVTGGFNFQNAWTTGWIAGTASGTQKK